MKSGRNVCILEFYMCYLSILFWSLMGPHDFLNLSIMFQVSCQIGDSGECEDFDAILGIIFEYVVQVFSQWQYSVSNISETLFSFDVLFDPAKRTKLDGYNSPRLEILVRCKSCSCALGCLLEPLSSNKFSRTHRRTFVGLPIQNYVVHLWGAQPRSSKRATAILLLWSDKFSHTYTLNQCAAKRDFAHRCLPRMYQDWFAPGYNAHPAAVYHMMEVWDIMIFNHRWMWPRKFHRLLKTILEKCPISGGGGPIHRRRNPQPILVQSRRIDWKGALVVEIRFRAGEGISTL